MGPGGFRSLQNCCDLAALGLVGSIPTRSRHAVGTLVLALLVSLGSTPSRARAQQRDSARAGVARTVPPPPVVPRPPVSARRAFLYSLMLPGLGQTALDRPTAGAFFFIIEATALGMVGKSLQDLREAKRFAGDSVPPILRFRPDTTGRVARDARTGKVLSDSASNRYRGSPSLVSSRRTHVEDWAAVVLFNHLISGADAFVAANLWDLPGEVQLTILPGGGMLGYRLTR